MVGEREIMDLIRGVEYEKGKALTEEEVNREIGDEEYIRRMVGERNTERLKPFVPLYSICTPLDAWRTNDIDGTRKEHEKQMEILKKLEKDGKLKR